MFWLFFIFIKAFLVKVAWAEKVVAQLGAGKVKSSPEVVRG